jgi:hypothetical protein
MAVPLLLLAPPGAFSGPGFLSGLRFFSAKSFEKSLTSRVANILFVEGWLRRVGEPVDRALAGR